MLFRYFSTGFIYCLLCFSYQSQAFLQDLYEKCNCENDIFTQRILDETLQYCPVNGDNPLFCKITNVEDIEVSTQLQMSKDQIPKVCFFSSALIGAKQYFPPEQYSYYYCESSKSNTIENMIFNNCESDEEPCTVSGYSEERKKQLCNRPPCLDERYISLTARAFNQIADCFSFTGRKDKERIFALLHHESRFLLSKVEEYPGDSSLIQRSTARCFGQIKNSFIETLNQYIYFGDRNKIARRSVWYEYGDIYREALNKCPFLSQIQTPDSETLNRKTLYGTDILTDSPINPFRKVHESQAESMICKTSQDPFSCLFYVFLSVKFNISDLQQILEQEELVDVTKWPGPIKEIVVQNEIPNSTSLNEVLILTGNLNSESKNWRIRSFIQNTAQLDQILQGQDVDYKASQFSVNSVPLFKDVERLKWSFIFYAHNGGSTIIRFRFSEFMQQLKRKIIDPSTCGDRRNICEEYHLSLLSGQSLDISVLHEEFTEYVKNNPVIDNKEQLYEFVTKINNDLKLFSNSGGYLLEALNFLHQGHLEQSEEMSEKVDWFLESVENNCPLSL